MSRERELVAQVAGDGFLAVYVDYARSLTAAPAVYHLATGLSVIAGVVGSHVSFMGAGDVEYWPNQYNLLLGASGMHKTTAMNIGLELLRNSAPGTVYSDQYSQEQFISALAEKPSRLLAVEEFSTILADMDRSYMVGLKELLTKLYDPRQDFVRSTKGEGNVTIFRPSVTVLGGSTIDWLVAHLKEVDFISGFMPRFLLWPSDSKEPEPPGGVLAKADQHVKNALIQQLAGMAKLRKVQAEFEPEAIKKIAAMSKAQARRKEEEGAPKELDGLIARCGSYAAKFCVLLAIADEGAQMHYRVTAEIAARAVSLMEWMVDQAYGLFEKQIIFERTERELQAILRLIPADGVPWSVALKRSRLTGVQFAAHIKTLTEREEVEVESRATATKTAKYLARKYPETRERLGSIGNDLGKDSRANGVVTPLASVRVEREGVQ